MNPIVQTKGVVKTYGGDGAVVHALQGIDLAIQQGEFTAMAGPSGSGKSTLLNILGGLDRPDSGSVMVEGQEITKLSRTELSGLRRNRIGFVFQNYNLVPVLTALENAEYVLMIRGVPKKERHDRVRMVLAEVGLGGMENRFPRELSGGQQQRVAIARAIVAEPALVLADEPTANVDSHTAAELLDLMGRLNAGKGITFFFSTHDPQVMKRSKRLILLRDGQIVSDGPPESAMTAS